MPIRPYPADTHPSNSRIPTDFPPHPREPHHEGQPGPRARRPASPPAPQVQALGHRANLPGIGRRLRFAHGFDPAHALLVRPLDIGGYQIISGHHRAAAAKQAGIEKVPCWVRGLSEEEAYMQLVLCNTQSELHPLEEGKHAVESGMDLKGYAEASAKNEKTLHTKVRAFRVLANLDVEIDMDAARKAWSNLSEIHAAPKWLWSALATKMIEEEWTVQATRDKVGKVKEVPKDLPGWVDAGALARRLENAGFSAYAPA